ncbi:MAG: hypothetical protein IPN69_07620 [Acidobacteria bacterium]|nr:hypothetical protein [Acidobacteriota bacterium]MBK8147410.1 hypothetical protein [Acidobacteriota bacterium]MBK8810588.1 hypothetical protein [Acidobacteriota bacterium]
MYCSGCGSAVNDKLNYCNICGAKLLKEEATAAKSMLENFLTTIAFVVLGGFGLLLGLVGILLKNGVDTKDASIIVIFYLAALTMISFMLLRLLPKLIDAKLNDGKTGTTEIYRAPQIAAKTPPQLEEPLQPAASVTEHTTRNFEKIPR